MGAGVGTEQIYGFKGERYGMGPDICKRFVPPRQRESAEGNDKGVMSNALYVFSHCMHRMNATDPPPFKSQRDTLH